MASKILDPRPTVAREVKEVLADYNYLLASTGDQDLSLVLLQTAYGLYDESGVADTRALELDQE
jgi:hypothetical protein